MALGVIPMMGISNQQNLPQQNSIAFQQQSLQQQQIQPPVIYQVFIFYTIN